MEGEVAAAKVLILASLCKTVESPHGAREFFNFDPKLFGQLPYGLGSRYPLWNALSRRNATKRERRRVTLVKDQVAREVLVGVSAQVKVEQGRNHSLEV